MCISQTLCLIPRTGMEMSEAADFQKFEDCAREIFSRQFGMHLKSGYVQGVPKKFDMVSSDGRIVGDAKYLTMVRGKAIPPAKFSVIAEHVWLLEKTTAIHKFIVFGNDRRVPEEWLKRYSHLVGGVEFYFLDERNRKIERLK